MPWVAAALFIYGGWLCCYNFYCYFLRYGVHLLRGGTRENYRWDSGCPLLGSLFVAISLAWFWSNPTMLIQGGVLILIDTGGVHWMICTIFYRHLTGKYPIPAAPTTPIVSDKADASEQYSSMPPSTESEN